MKLALLFLALAGYSAARSEIVGKTVDYSADGISLKGYIAYDNAIKGQRPGIIVVHEWWGLTDYPKKRADMLASLGYVAFAADMYGDGKTADNPGDAQKFAGESARSMDTLKAKFLAALEVLKKNEFVNPQKIGAIGYCYGGGVVLNMASAGVDLNAVVSFHGSLGSVKAPEKGAVKGMLLVCNGGADKFISEKDIDNFKTGMKNAGVDYKFISYKNSLHAFTNPDATELGKKFNMPIAYNEAADKKSWKDMQSFFKKAFK